MRRLVFLCLLAACGRDLALPPQALPPRIDSISPKQGFAGDTLTLTGANLADASLQVFFDVRTAVILTPPQQRDGKTVQVQVPQDVLGTDVSVSTSQGTAKAADPFTYLGLGHPRTVALRATVPLKPNIALAFPLTGGEWSALLDWRYGMVLAQQPDGEVSIPARVGDKPVLAFGPPEAAWVLDAPDNGPLTLVPFDMTTLQPTAGTPLALRGGTGEGADGSPSGTRFAIPNGSGVDLYNLSTRARGSVALPDDVVLVRFAGESTLIGFTKSQPFRIELTPAPVLSLGAALDAAAQPSSFGAGAAVAPSHDKLAYTTSGNVRFLTWGAAGAPVLDAAHVLDAKIWPHAVAFTADGNTLLVADEVHFVVAACDIASGQVLSAQSVPGIGSLALFSEGPNQGYFLAATDTGASLLFPSAQVLRSDVVPVQIRGIAVDPKCGDLIAATVFGPLQLPQTTLTPLAVDSSLQLDGLQGSDGGVVAWSGNDMYVYVPPAACRGYGSFRHVAVADNPSIGAALSADGKWVATSDGETMELIPRSDNGAGLAKKTAHFAQPDLTPVRYAGDSLTVGHTTPNQGYAISTYAPGTLTETASLPLDGTAVDLERVRFAQAWLIDQKVIQNGDFVATGVTVWDETRGVIATANVPASFTVPAGISADGFMLVGVSTIGRDAGVDTLVLQVLQGKLIQEPGPHVDLPGSPGKVLSSPDGARLYASLPDQSAIAVIE